MNSSKLLGQVTLVLGVIKKQAHIRQRLSAFGYDDYQIQEGEKLQKLLQGVLQKEQKALTQSQQATHSLHCTRDHIQARYQQQVAIVRQAFGRHAEVSRLLKLSTKENESMETWLLQVQHFYQHAPRFADTLQAYGVSLTELEEIRILARQMAELAELQKHLQLRINRINQEKQRVSRQAEVWYLRLIRVSRLALQGAPQNLELLGIATA